MGMILDEVFRMRYYGQLYPAMENMREILTDGPPLSTHRGKTERSDKSAAAPFMETREETDSSPTIPHENIDFIQSSDNSSPQVLASSTINNAKVDDEEEEEGTGDEYYDEYEYDEESEEEEGDGNEEESEYEYEYEYEYDSDGEFEDDAEPDTEKDGKK